jgi:hypothetical protein
MTPMIGHINDEGLWVVTAGEAEHLPDGSLVAPLGDERGRPVPHAEHAATEPGDARPWRGRVRVDGGWVGPAGPLFAGETYRVLHPPSPSHVSGEVAMSRSQFETALAASRAEHGLIGVEYGSSTWVAAQDVIPGVKNRYGTPWP